MTESRMTEYRIGGNDPHRVFVPIPETVGGTCSGFWSIGDTDFATSKMRYRDRVQGEDASAGVVVRHVPIMAGTSARRALEIATMECVREVARRKERSR